MTTSNRQFCKERERPHANMASGVMMLYTQAGATADTCGRECTGVSTQTPGPFKSLLKTPYSRSGFKLQAECDVIAAHITSGATLKLVLAQSSTF